MNINSISNTTKNVMYLVLLIGQAAWVIFSVYANEKAIVVNDARSEKRYKRGMQFGKDHETRLRKLEKRITYIEGKEGY